jgi:hypothetical protein
VHTEIYTWFTKPGPSTLVYSAEGWVRVRVRLETAGPVSLSTRQDVVPVLSGKGALLTTDEVETFTLPKGDRLYIAAEAINRVKVFIEPVPFLERIQLDVERGFASVGRAINSLRGRVGGGSKPAPAPAEPDLPCIPNPFNR